MIDDITKIQKKLNSKEILPAKGFRRDMPIYELVCYVNNITGCFLSENYLPIGIFIERARNYMEDYKSGDKNEKYYNQVTEYLNLIEKYLEQKRL